MEFHEYLLTTPLKRKWKELEHSLIVKRVLPNSRVLQAVFLSVFIWVNSLLQTKGDMWFDGVKRPLLSAVRFLLVYILKCK